MAFPHTCFPFNVLHGHGTFVNGGRVIVYTKVDPCCRPFCGLGQMSWVRHRRSARSSFPSLNVLCALLRTFWGPLLGFVQREGKPALCARGQEGSLPARAHLRRGPGSGRFDPLLSRRPPLPSPPPGPAEDGPRAVFMVDLWHPHVAAAERQALDFIFAPGR